MCTDHDMNITCLALIALPCLKRDPPIVTFYAPEISPNTLSYTVPANTHSRTSFSHLIPLSQTTLFKDCPYGI